MMEYYSVIKWNKALIRTIAWMNFENIVSERNHTTYHMLNDFIYMKCLKLANLQGQKADQ